jgi:ornithine carbamoyltransferase
MRDFLGLSVLTPATFNALLDCADALKRHTTHALPGRILAMIFEKPSMRTRLSFEVAMIQLGGTALDVLPTPERMGKRESIPDMARVLSRYADAVVIRCFSQDDIEAFAAASQVPVINGLSDMFHPCQAMADMMTIRDKFETLAGLKLSYLGDVNNVSRSLAEATALAGMEMAIACPSAYMGDIRRYDHVQVFADPAQAVKGADVVYTDVWTSMGQEEESQLRRKAFASFTVTPAIMATAKPGAIFMHCLPAHRGEEVDDAVIENPQSVVFDQAENRLHIQKAILMGLLGGKS